MSKIYSKEPKHFTLVKGVEVIKIVFADDAITSVVLKIILELTLSLFIERLLTRLWLRTQEFLHLYFLVRKRWI